MKATGVVRKVDNLGRLVIPSDLRKALNMQYKDSVEMFVDEEYIVLGKHYPKCVLCGYVDDIVNYKGKNVCKKCIQSF